MSVQVSYKKQIIFGILIICIFLSVLEGFVRVYEIINPHCVFMDSEALETTSYLLSRIMCIDHDRTFSTLEFSVIPIPCANQHYTTININSDNLRGKEILLDKSENTYRIIMVGGSTVFGVVSSSDDKTIPGYLQKEFDLQSEKEIEVINGGFGNADSASELYFIKNKFLAFNPDMIIWYHGWNDAENEITRINYDKSEHSNECWYWPMSSSWRTPYLYDIVFWPDKPYISDMPPYTKLLSELQTKGKIEKENILVRTELIESRWNEMCSLSKENEIKSVIMIQPILGTGNKTFSIEEEKWLERPYEKTYLETLESFAQNLKNLENKCDKTVDMRNVFDGIKEPLYMDMGHVTDRGNEIIAKKIHDEIYPIIHSVVENLP